MVRRHAGDDAQHVLVIGQLGPRSGEGGRRRTRAPAPVDIMRATVIEAEPLADASEWLGRDAGERVDGALAVLNRALHARRIAAADPYGGELALVHAVVTRVGYGTGEQVAEGRWTEARTIPPSRARVARAAALRPQERFAALLAGRDVALASELLALRARLDLEHGRDREAALQLAAALAVALPELDGWRDLDGLPERLEELRALDPEARLAAAAARAGTLDEARRAAVVRALERLEAALRARTAGARF